MAEITTQNIDSLKSELTKKREAIRAFRNASAGSRTKNVREGRTLRKDVARILTELRSRELASVKKTA